MDTKRLTVPSEKIEAGRAVAVCINILFSVLEGQYSAISATADTDLIQPDWLSSAYSQLRKADS